MDPPTFIPLPDYTEPYNFNLGDVIRDLRRPESVLLSFPDTQLVLSGPARHKTLGAIHKSWGEEQSRSYSLFAKIMEIFNLRMGRDREADESETYDVGETAVDKFDPTPTFLDALAKLDPLSEHFSGSSGDEDGGPRAFLVTGILTAKDIKYSGSKTQGGTQEGELGFDAQGGGVGVGLGFKGKRAKKKVVKGSYEVAGPAQLALRLLKLQLGDSGQVEAEDELKGAKFGAGDDDQEGSEQISGRYLVAPLDEADLDGMADGDLLDEDGKPCVLLAPSV